MLELYPDKTPYVKAIADEDSTCNHINYSSLASFFLLFTVF